MKRIVLAILAWASVAHAQPMFRMQPGWKKDDEQTRSLTARTSEQRHFGTMQTKVSTFAATKSGVALFWTRVSVDITADRDRAVRAEVDELHGSSRRAALSGSGITEDDWQQHVDPVKKQVDARLTWRDTIGGTIDVSHLVIAGDAEHLVGVLGECIALTGADPRGLADCKATIETIDPGVTERVDIAMAPEGSGPVPAADVGAPVPTVTPSSNAPSMQDGSHVPVAPMTISPAAPPPDRRPVYVGGGVVVLAALFWWNRYRRERFEREDAPKESDDR
ncbi:MAG: hypothetical protein JWO36_2176 [Myxococcales bacterium]|nr:hypothetical protein [Myxococcales bacterium]